MEKNGRFQTSLSIAIISKIFLNNVRVIVGSHLEKMLQQNSEIILKFFHLHKNMIVIIKFKIIVIKNLENKNGMYEFIKFFCYVYWEG